jgi:hypothetical protein
MMVLVPHKQRRDLVEGLVAVLSVSAVYQRRTNAADSEVRRVAHTFCGCLSMRHYCCCYY